MRRSTAAIAATKGEKLPETIDPGFKWYDKTNIDAPEIAAVLTTEALRLRLCDCGFTTAALGPISQRPALPWAGLAFTGRAVFSPARQRPPNLSPETFPAIFQQIHSLETRPPPGRADGAKVVNTTALPSHYPASCRFSQGIANTPAPVWRAGLMCL